MSGQRLSYSVGFPLPHNTSDLLELIPADVWTPAYDAHDQIRDGAWVAELTGLLDMSKWPEGMRVIARKERPHPGAQLRITDVDGHRVTAFATNTKTGGPATQLPDLELRHRRRARCEDRIRVSKDTGLTNLPSRVRSESDLVRHRGPGCGDHRVDADARPERAPSQTLGTKTIAATTVHPPGDDRTHWPAGTPPPGDQSSLGRPSQRRRQPATSPGRPRLMSTPPVPTTTARPRPPGTGAHPRRHSGHRHTPMTKSMPAGDPQLPRRSTLEACKIEARFADSNSSPCCRRMWSQ
jgi:hypothetical protein